MTTSPRRSPRHLSDTALIVLGRAADSGNQMLLPIPKSVRARGMAFMVKRRMSHIKVAVGSPGE